MNLRIHSSYLRVLRSSSSAEAHLGPKFEMRHCTGAREVPISTAAVSHGYPARLLMMNYRNTLHRLTLLPLLLSFLFCPGTMLHSELKYGAIVVLLALIGAGLYVSFDDAPEAAPGLGEVCPCPRNPVCSFRTCLSTSRISNPSALGA